MYEKQCAMHTLYECFVNECAPAYYLSSTGFRNCRVKFYNVYGVPALDKRNYHSIHSHDTLVFWLNLHTNTFCKYRKNYAHRLACILCYI